MKSNKKDKKNLLRLIILFLLGGFLVKLFTFLFNKKKLDLDDVRDNLDDFVNEEKKEVEELVEGKESIKKYFHDSTNILKDYFIPNDNNDNRPKILRVKPLLIIALVAVLLKAGVLGYLFFIYPDVAKMQQEITSEIIALTNDDRQNNNLPILEMNAVLSSAAQNKANDMIANNYFSHYGLDGKEPWYWVDREEYAYLNIGENLAMNFSSADSAHSALMQSPLHKKNILNNDYQDIGLAIATGEINGKNTTILVELFGGQEETIQLTLVEATSETNNTPLEITETEIKVLALEKTQPETAIEIENENTAPETTEETVVTENEIIETEIKQEDTRENIVAQIEPKNDLNQEALYVIPQQNKKIGVATTLIKFSKYFYAGLLITTIIILLINVFVRITIQHKSIIIQSLFVILFLVGLYFVKFHILEDVIEKIIII